jgi:hypothetical protein
MRKILLSARLRVVCVGGDRAVTRGQPLLRKTASAMPTATLATTTSAYNRISRRFETMPTVAERRPAPTVAPTRTSRRTARAPVRPRPAPAAAPARNTGLPSARRLTVVSRSCRRPARPAVGLNALPTNFDRGGAATDRTGEVSAEPKRAREPGTCRPTAMAGRATSTTTIRPTSERTKSESAGDASCRSRFPDGCPSSRPPSRTAGASPEPGLDACGWSGSFAERMRASPSRGSSG